MAGRDPELMARIEAMTREWDLDHKQEELLEDRIYGLIEVELHRLRRDSLAGQALAGLAANPYGVAIDGNNIRRDPAAYALAAYAMADAMLAERSKAK